MPGGEHGRDYVDWGSGELLAMTALDNYPVPDDGLPTSTSVVFRIHQLGRHIAALTRRAEQEREEASVWKERAETAEATVAHLQGKRWLETTSKVVVDIMGSAPACAESGCQYQRGEAERDRLQLVVSQTDEDGAWATAKMLEAEAELDQLRAERDELLAVLKEYVEWFGAVHGQECPGDDTCACIGGALNERVNAAIRRGDSRRDGTRSV